MQSRMKVTVIASAREQAKQSPTAMIAAQALRNQILLQPWTGATRTHDTKEPRNPDP